MLSPSAMIRGVRSRREIDAASRAAYGRLRGRLILARMRVVARFGVAFVGVGAALNLALAPDHVAERMSALAIMGVVEVVSILAARIRLARRRPQVTCGAAVLAIGLVLLYLLAQSPGDVDVLAGPVSAVMIGSTLLYPVGAATQAVVCAGLAAGYAVGLWPLVSHGGMRAVNVALTLGVGVVLSVLGAAVLERSRQQAWIARRRVRTLAVQRRRLMEIGRDLWSTLEPDVVVARAARHARLLVPCDGTTVDLVHPATRAIRTAAMTGDTMDRSLLGVDWPAEGSAAFLEAFGAAEVREFPGSPFDDMLAPHMRAFRVRRVLGAAIGSGPQPDGLVWWSRRDDVPFTEAERMAAQGLAEQLYSALRAARLYEETRRASQLKSDFVSTMSHELRTPLNVIIGYNQILRDTAADGDTLRMLDTVHRASLELLDLVQSTLDLGRIESGREQVEVEPVALPKLFAELAAEVTPVPHGPGVGLTWDPGDVESLTVDRRKLKTIVKNLVANAVKFTPAGEVSVRARRVDDRVEIVVRDTGIGISPADQAVVFEMFRQADSSDARRYGGTGLGLYIVRRLVDLLDGTITLESARGSGTVFTVTVPRRGRSSAGPRQAA